jgi:hypothetical protein
VSTAAGRRLDTAEQRRFARIAVWLLVVTIAYNVVESIVAVAAGLEARSVALTGFDSAIEVVAAAIVLWRLSAELRHGTVDERLRALAITFFALAANIAAGIRDLLTAARPETSLIGIGLTALQRSTCRYWRLQAPQRATAGQPAGGDRCRRDQALRLALRLDARRTRVVCAHWLGWLDAVAGFVIAYFAIREGRGAWSGEDDA